MRYIAAIALLAVTVGTGCAYFEPESFPWIDWVVGLINFAVFAAVIIKFGGPHIQRFFANRREDFLRNMKAATKAREEAEAKLEEYNARLESLERDRQALLDEYHAQGEREKQQIIETAKRQVEKMRTDAEATIDQEVKKAVAMLEQQAVDLAIEMAQNKAKDQLDEARQKELFERYVSELDDSAAA